MYIYIYTYIHIHIYIYNIYIYIYIYIQISLKKVFEKIVFWHFQIKTHKAYIYKYNQHVPFLKFLFPHLFFHSSPLQPPNQTQAYFNLIKNILVNLIRLLLCHFVMSFCYFDFWDLLLRITFFHRILEEVKIKHITVYDQTYDKNLAINLFLYCKW